MTDFEIVAEGRTALGKAATRRLRRQGLVPTVLYGGEHAPATLCVRENELKKQLENEAFYSHILTVRTPDGAQQAVLKALQRHPASGAVTHVDLLRTSATQMLTMQVPLHFMNEESSPGRKAGGVVAHNLTELEIRCLPGNLPEFIAVDVGALDLGDTIHLTDLQLPEGVTLTAFMHGDIAEHDQVVVSVQATRLDEADEEDEGDAGDEGDEGDEAG